VQLQPTAFSKTFLRNLSPFCKEGSPSNVLDCKEAGGHQAVVRFLFSFSPIADTESGHGVEPPNFFDQFFDPLERKNQGRIFAFSIGANFCFQLGSDHRREMFKKAADFKAQTAVGGKALKKLRCERFPFSNPFKRLSPSPPPTLLVGPSFSSH
jgi:hypothetical protein